MRFENLKPGDAVAIYGRGTLEKRTAERVTATMFVLDGGARKFSRRSGREHGSTSWSSVWAEHWTAEHDRDLLERKREQEVKDMRYSLRGISWHSLDEDKLRAAHAAMVAAGVLPSA